MNAGFSHFDACWTENFAAALLCLVVECDAGVRDALVALVETRLGRALGPLLEIEREHRLDGTEQKSFQRADLCLRFASGVILIEVKSHGEWDAESVATQVKNQAASSGPLAWGQKPLAALLLAPSVLARQVETLGVTTLRWAEVIQSMRQASSDSPLVKRAVRHLEDNVERPFGLDDLASPGDLAGAVQRVACLRDFLRACAYAVGRSPDEGKLNLTGADGRPYEWEGWAWHGLSIPLRGGGRIGLYTYLKTPSGDEKSLASPWVEIYTDDDNRPFAYVPFEAQDLREATLQGVVKRVADEFKARLQAKA